MCHNLNSLVVSISNTANYVSFWKRNGNLLNGSSNNNDSSKQRQCSSTPTVQRTDQ